MNRGDGFFAAGLIAFMVFCILGLSGNLPGQCEPHSDKLVCQHHQIHDAKEVRAQK